MWSRSLEVFNPYEAIKAGIESGKYDKENLSFWKKIFRISYAHNGFGIYKEFYLFNKKIYCNLVCRYIY
jgi:hypothetical protein